MELFWQHGYEGVSIHDLTTAIGIAPPSLYAAFGSKAGLYREVLDHYASRPGSLDLSVIGRAASLHDAVSFVLSAAITSVGHSGQACMISVGMLACRPEHDEIAQDLSRRRQAFETALCDGLARWLAPEDAAAMGRYLAAVMQGISIHARDGATAAELESIAGHALKALPPANQIEDSQANSS